MIEFFIAMIMMLFAFFCAAALGHWMSKWK